ncbi:MAG: hypothetical protein LE168_00700 [Endomicrobium sp.]|nr:hypothetical protein [Endomicrobium sp.]
MNHFASSGWMGDYDDVKISLFDTDRPREVGRHVIKVTYNAKMAHGVGDGLAFAGNNWQIIGVKKGGYNLTGAKRLSFWANGTNGGEIITEFKMGGITGEFPDSDFASIGTVTLAKEWTRYAIDIKIKI